MNVGLIEEIHNLIDTQSDRDQLANIEQKLDVPVHIIQTAIKQFVKNLDDDEVRSRYYKTISLEKIFSLDVLQLIEGFCHSFRNELISLKFKECYQKNNRLFWRERQRTIDKYMNRFPFMEYRPDSADYRCKTWIAESSELSEDHDLHEHMDFITDSNKIITNFAEAVRMSKNGDRILMKGKYELSTQYGVLRFSGKHIQIIGLGEGATICSNDTTLDVTEGANISMSNIKWSFEGDCLHKRVPMIMIRRGSRLWMSDCTVLGKETLKYVITVRRNASEIHLLRSKIVGTYGIFSRGTKNMISVIDTIIYADICAGMVRSGSVLFAGNILQLASWITISDGVDSECIGNLVNKGNVFQSFDGMIEMKLEQ